MPLSPRDQERLHWYLREEGLKLSEADVAKVEAVIVKFLREAQDRFDWGVQ